MMKLVNNWNMAHAVSMDAAAVLYSIKILFTKNLDSNSLETHDASQFENKKLKSTALGAPEDQNISIMALMEYFPIK